MARDLVAKAAYDRQYYIDNRERLTRQDRDYRLVRQFNMTAAEYDAKFVAQQGCCFICGKPESVTYEGRPIPIPLAIDHDHSCCPGKSSCGNCIRELLCSRCNVGIGMLSEDVDVLISAIEYLSYHKTGGRPA